MIMEKKKNYNYPSEEGQGGERVVQGKVYMNYQQLCLLLMSDSYVFTLWLYNHNTHSVSILVK